MHLQLLLNQNVQFMLWNTYLVAKSSTPAATSFRPCGRGAHVAIRRATANTSIHGVEERWRTAVTCSHLGPESWRWRPHLLLVVAAIHWGWTARNNKKTYQSWIYVSIKKDIPSYHTVELKLHVTCWPRHVWCYNSKKATILSDQVTIFGLFIQMDNFLPKLFTYLILIIKLS